MKATIPCGGDEAMPGQLSTTLGLQQRVTGMHHHVPAYMCTKGWKQGGKQGLRGLRFWLSCYALGTTPPSLKSGKVSCERICKRSPCMHAEGKGVTISQRGGGAC